MNRCLPFGFAVVVACGPSSSTSSPLDPSPSARGRVTEAGDTRSPSPMNGARLPLELVADVDLPGRAARFDYQGLDSTQGNLIVAHMNDASVVVVKASDGALVKVIPNVPRARGVVVADEVGRIFVTSSPNKLVILDNVSLDEIARVDTGAAPDGVGWDPTHGIVAVSDQGDGALSLLAGAGTGARTQVKLGRETGNVVFDLRRQVFWVTLVTDSPGDELAAVDPVNAKVVTRIGLPGCSGAHGLRLAPDEATALIACEKNSKLVRVQLGGDHHAREIADTGADPDVLAVDPGLGWLYVAAESGDLRVFDLTRPGLVQIGSEHPGDASHSVAVDPRTHFVFFPLVKGQAGKPALRIMKPRGT